MQDIVLNLLGAQNPNAPMTQNSWRDIFCVPFNDVPASTQDAEMRIDNCYGVGFTGALPPGACLAVARGDDRAALGAWRDALSQGDARPWALYNYTALTQSSGYPSDANRPPANVSILRAGDVMCWGQPETVSCWAFNPFLYNSGFAGVEEDTFSTISSQILLPRGVVRSFQRPDIIIPPSLAYTRVPWVSESSYGNAPSSVTDGQRVFGSHLTIHWKANSSDMTRISTTKSFEVWWLTAAGLWAHNDSDDFDVAGRGQVTSSHDAETYEIPQAAQRVHIVDALATGATETPVLIFEDRNPR